jgi:membrane-bound metal-dependent hydrolase YbcI (DUF457 family)
MFFAFSIMVFTFSIVSQASTSNTISMAIVLIVICISLAQDEVLTVEETQTLGTMQRTNTILLLTRNFMGPLMPLYRYAQ